MWCRGKRQIEMIWAFRTNDHVKFVGMNLNRGKSRKAWVECVKQDMDLINLRQEWALNKDL